MDHPILHEPSAFAVKPFRITDHLFYVGNSWVGSYLLDTGSGLILIDCSVAQTVDMILACIRELGFDFRRIRKILLTHAHFDHAGGAASLQRYTGAEIYLGKEDWFFISERPELLLAEYDSCPLFLPDHCYREGVSVSQGDISVYPVHTPGHTPGTWSIFFRDTWNDQEYLCGMHGGLGFNTLRDEYFKWSGLPITLRQDYRYSLSKLSRIPVDIHLGSHPAVAHMLEKAERGITGGSNPFIVPGEWQLFLREKMHAYDEAFG